MKRLHDSIAKAGEGKGPGTKRLTKLEPGEVSVVSRAANRKRFYVYKNAEGEPMNPDASHVNLLAALEGISEDDLEQINKAAETVAIAKADGSEAADSRLQTTLRAVGKMLVPYTKAREDGTPAITRADLNPIFEALGIGDSDAESNYEADADQAEEQFNMSVEKGVDGPGSGPGIEKAEAAMSGMSKPDGASDADHEAAKKAAKDAYDAAMAKAGFSGTKKAEDEKKPEPDTKSEDAKMEKDDVAKSALKGFNPEQRAALEPIFKSQREAIAKAEAKAARLEETLLRKEIVAKAAGYKNLGVSADDLAEQLFDMQTKHPEGLPRFEKLLKSLDAQAGHGSLYKEVGSSAPAATGSSAAERLDGAVASIVAKSDGRSKAQVYRDFIKTPEGQELYKAYTVEQRIAQREG